MADAGGQSCFYPEPPLLRPVKLREQSSHVQRPRDHLEVALLCAGPLLARAVPLKLDAILVWVTEVDCFGDAVVGGADYQVLRIQKCL